MNYLIFLEFNRNAKTNNEIRKLQLDLFYKLLVTCDFKVAQFKCDFQDDFELNIPIITSIPLKRILMHVVNAFQTNYKDEENKPSIAPARTTFFLRREGAILMANDLDDLLHPNDELSLWKQHAIERQIFFGDGFTLAGKALAQLVAKEEWGSVTGF
eukprot:TRINITY_DN17240_c0_g1_i3.p1 TRINITY_DN17240_c0_g1~~TRINITY_DN17240_c0_g1_i3.p1  ORF type:complete len:157 (+),score=14.82 TRINITY_DN17240_c0_g1_i3:61-531(+)